MRKLLRFLVTLLCLLAFLIGCNKENNEASLNDLRPMLMVDGLIYLDTGTEMTIDEEQNPPHKFEEITSTVSQTEKPTEDGQSNFGSIGDQYFVDGDRVLVRINSKWIVFEPEKNEGA